MSDNSQPQPVQPVDQDKKAKPKWSVKLFGKYVPLWLVVVVVAVVAWVAWHMWVEHEKQVISLSNSTKQNLDQLVASSASPSSAAGVPLTTPSTEEVRKQLNKLFNSF